MSPRLAGGVGVLPRLGGESLGPLRSAFQQRPDAMKQQHDSSDDSGGDAKVAINSPPVQGG